MDTLVTNNTVNTPPPVLPPATEKKGDGFNINTFNPMLFLTLFGITELNENVTSMDSASQQMLVQENVMEESNTALSKLVNKTIPEQKSLNLWGKFLHKCSGDDGSNEDYASDMSKARSMFPSMFSNSRSLCDSYWVEDLGVKEEPNEAQMAEDQGNQTMLNTSTTQANNNLNNTMKLGVENASEKNSQVAQMITTQLQNLGVMMTVKIN